MKAILCQKFGTPDDLVLADITDPVPGPGEVVARVAAAGLNFLDVLLSKKQWGSNNDSYYSNPQVEELLNKAAPMTDLKQRYALYHQAEDIVIADAPWVFLQHPKTFVIHQPWVHNYVLNPMRPTRFEKVWLSKH